METDPGIPKGGYLMSSLKSVQFYAASAFDFMNEILDDSFGPIDAARVVVEMFNLPENFQEKIIDEMNRAIGSEGGSLMKTLNAILLICALPALTSAAETYPICTTGIIAFTNPLAMRMGDKPRTDCIYSMNLSVPVQRIQKGYLLAGRANR